MGQVVVRLPSLLLAPLPSPDPHWSGQVFALTDWFHISNRVLMRGLLIALMMEAAVTYETSVGETGVVSLLPGASCYFQILK
jgi:extradiol dioxygenase family protein